MDKHSKTLSILCSVLFISLITVSVFFVRTQSELKKAQRQLDSIEGSTHEVRSQYDTLSTKIGSFDDGTNWQDVVSDVQSEVSELDAAIYTLELEVSD